MSLSEEYKRKISEANTGRRHTIERDKGRDEELAKIGWTIIHIQGREIIDLK